MSTTQAAKTKALQSIQWPDADWDYVGEVARSIGLTRSAFVRNAALNAARAVAGSVSPYSVGEAEATPQNTRIKLFSGEAGQKLAPGGGQDAADRSRSDGEAKGGTTSELQAHRPDRAVSRKS